MASKINYSTRFSIVGLSLQLHQEAGLGGFCTYVSPPSRFSPASKLSNLFESGHLLTIWNCFIFSLHREGAEAREGGREGRKEGRKSKGMRKKKKKRMSNVTGSPFYFQNFLCAYSCHLVAPCRPTICLTWVLTIELLPRNTYVPDPMSLTLDCREKNVVLFWAFNFQSFAGFNLFSSICCNFYEAPLGFMRKTDQVDFFLKMKWLTWYVLRLLLGHR